MSEVGYYESKIKFEVTAHSANIETNPSFEILKKSIDIVAKEYNGTIKNYVIDASNRKTGCNIAISTHEFSRGVGVQINPNNGEVSFLYDSSGGYEDLADRISKEITQNYVAIAIIRAMKSFGYQVEERSQNKGKAVVLIGRA